MGGRLRDGYTGAAAPAATSQSNERIGIMSELYKVRLGIDRGARDTRRRLTLTVPAEDRLAAAIAAERIGDGMVRDPQVEYTHAIAVTPVSMRRMAAAVIVA